MKKQILLFSLIVAIGLLLGNCGTSNLPENQYLGKLPSLAAKYQSEIAELKEKAKQATSMDDAFQYEKEYKLKKEEADKAFDDYLATAEFPNTISFDNLAENKFEVMDITIKSASRTRVNLQANVVIKENLKSKYGNNKKYFFAYFKAVDKEGNMLGRACVMSSNLGGGGPYTTNMKTIINGSLEKLSEMANFEKIVFITKDEYSSNK